MNTSASSTDSTIPDLFVNSSSWKHTTSLVN
jgi:hypothetical protein